MNPNVLYSDYSGLYDDGYEDFVAEKEQLYVFRWGNNPQRAKMKGRVCRVLARGGMNSCKIQFVDNGQTECVSRNALRKVKGWELKSA